MNDSVELSNWGRREFSVYEEENRQRQSALEALERAKAMERKLRRRLRVVRLNANTVLTATKNYVEQFKIFNNGKY